MKKYIELSEEVLTRLDEGKYVEGSFHKDQQTGKLIFRAYVRTRRFQKDRLVCQLEHGWLKESPARYKFFNSVKKEVGLRLVSVAMHRELKEAMETLDAERLISANV